MFRLVARQPVVANSGGTEDASGLGVLDWWIVVADADGLGVVQCHGPEHTSEVGPLRMTGTANTADAAAAAANFDAVGESRVRPAAEPACLDGDAVLMATDVIHEHEGAARLVCEVHHTDPGVDNVAAPMILVLVQRYHCRRLTDACRHLYHP